VQLSVHVPLEQIPVIPVPPPHTVPHAPQFDALVARFVSHPFVGSPSQFSK
jgi:hypothetical protein